MQPSSECEFGTDHRTTQQYIQLTKWINTMHSDQGIEQKKIKIIHDQLTRKK